MVEITRTDLGLTENEWNDFMIDLFSVMEKGRNSDAKVECVNWKASVCEPVVITITENDLYIPNMIKLKP